MARKISVRMLVSDVCIGGAQIIAADILRGLDSERFDGVYWSIATPKEGALTILSRYGKSMPPISYIGTKTLSTGIAALVRKLREEHVDVLHCHLPHNIIMGTVAALFVPGVKVIAHYHSSNAFYSWKLRMAMFFLRPFITLNIFYSAEVEREISGKAHLSDDISSVRSCTVHNFVDTDMLDRTFAETDRQALRHSWGLRGDELIVLMTGRMVDWKGHEMVLRSLAVIRTRMQKVRLVFVGDGPERAKLESLTNDLDLGSRVIFLGEQPDPFRFLAAADVFASPYQFKEGFPTGDAVGVSTLEAMAAGVPVIISDYQTSHAFVVNGQTGILVSPGTVEGLAEALENMCADMTLRESIGNAARTDILKRFSLRNALEWYMQTYRTLISP